MSSTLIVYGTGSGCTTGVAERIGTTLSARGVDVEVCAAQDAPSAAGYDAVIVGSGVRGGNWHASVKEWLSGNAAPLAQTPVALFTVGLTLAQDPEKAAEMRAYTDPLIRESGIEPVDVGVFAGWNEPKRFSLPERLIMRMLKAPQGDFRDWAAIEQWTDDVAPRLGLA